jgi:hypothetical protein
MTDEFAHFTRRTRALHGRRNHCGQRPTLRASAYALAALFTLSHSALGQTPAEQEAAPIDESVDLETPPKPQAWSLFAGYTSHELSNPGFHFGTDYPLASTAHFQSIVSGSFQAYYQQNTETGVALHARWGQLM